MTLFRILLVDDNRDILTLLKVLFEAEGMYVFCADGGKDAIKVFKENPFDMVITDLNMPEMDGFEVAKNIRFVNPGIPIIMMTGSSELPNNPSDYGISQIFAKPVDLKRVLAAVEKIAQGSAWDTAYPKPAQDRVSSGHNGWRPLDIRTTCEKRVQKVQGD